MKEVREDRFTKREDVGFNPAPIAEPRPAQRSEEVSNERTHARSRYRYSRSMRRRTS